VSNVTWALYEKGNFECPDSSQETRKAPALEGQSQDSDVNTHSTYPPSVSSVAKIDEADEDGEDGEATGDPSDTEGCDGDYWFDYTPDVPYMSGAHLLMQHKEAVLMNLLQRFEGWPVPTSHATDGHDAPDSHSPPQPYGEKRSQGRNKRARNGSRKGDSNSGSSEQDSKATNAKKPRKGDRERRPRLACPYYKKAPMRYYDCHSKIISSISHLKQHLSRNHQLPVYCPVCKDVFSH
jgi:hypothetical protein